MQGRADSPPLIYIWVPTLDSQGRTEECGVLERGTKEIILSQLLGSGRMLRSCLLGTLAEPLRFCVLLVCTAQEAVFASWPRRVGIACGCCELLWLLARAEPFSVSCQQTLALLMGGLAQKHSKDHVGLSVWSRASAQGWSDCSLWFLSCWHCSLQIMRCKEKKCRKF